LAKYFPGKTQFTIKNQYNNLKFYNKNNEANFSNRNSIISTDIETSSNANNQLSSHRLASPPNFNKYKSYSNCYKFMEDDHLNPICNDKNSLINEANAKIKSQPQNLADLAENTRNVKFKIEKSNNREIQVQQDDNNNQLLNNKNVTQKDDDLPITYSYNINNNFVDEYNNIFKHRDSLFENEDNNDEELHSFYQVPALECVDIKQNNQDFNNYNNITNDNTKNDSTRSSSINEVQNLTFLNLTNDLDSMLFNKFNHIKNMFLQINDSELYNNINYNNADIWKGNIGLLQQHRELNSNIEKLKKRLYEVQANTYFKNQIVREHLLEQIEIFIELIHFRRLQVELFYKCAQ